MFIIKKKATYLILIYFIFKVCVHYIWIQSNVYGVMVKHLFILQIDLFKLPFLLGWGTVLIYLVNLEYAIKFSMIIKLMLLNIWTIFWIFYDFLYF